MRVKSLHFLGDLMESIPGYDAWKTRGPPEWPDCSECGGTLNEASDCEDCGCHTMTEEDERDAKGDYDYERSREADWD